MKQELLINEMINYNKNDPKRIQHFIKVHSFAKTIGVLEHLDKETLFTLETAAITHDIGIKLSEEKYGKCTGKMQEQEGPPEARELLTKLDYESKIIERVCYLIGHHHTYTDINGLDYQILVEADFLVNIYEDNLKEESIKNIKNEIFKTKSGIDILCNIYL